MDAAKVGERGPVWWDDGKPDLKTRSDEYPLRRLVPVTRRIRLAEIYDRLGDSMSLDTNLKDEGGRRLRKAGSQLSIAPALRASLPNFKQAIQRRVSRGTTR